MHRTFSTLLSVTAAALLGCVVGTATSAVAAEPDASVAARPKAFDYNVYRAAAEELARLDPGGRIGRVEWSDEELTFERLGRRYAFDLATATLTDEGEIVREEEGEGRRRSPRRRGPARGRQRDRETSPDGQWTAVAQDWNVALEPADGGEALEVTTDGHRKLRYGEASWVYGEELAQRTAMWWSPDSSKLVFYEFDERDVPDYHLLGGLTDRYTTTMVEGYPKPGDPNPQASLVVYDVATGETKRIQAAADADAGDEEWYLYNVRFTPNGDDILLSRTNRHQNVLHVDVADPATGATRRVLTETQSTWQKNRPMMRFLEDGERFIWETQESGATQYELRHLDGRHLSTLTSGPMAISVVAVDEEAGVMYYTAHGEEHPLHVHLHRVGLDGADARRLTQEPATHTPRLSPDHRWFTTQYETTTQPPTTALYDTDGRRIATLAESDPARISALGYPEPELFTFKADDGVTDLYGWLHKPRGFDPNRKYPLVIDVYGGPSSRGVRNTYRAGLPAAALGFIVAKIDNRGTGGRGKDFLGAVYQKLGVVDIQDQADGVRHLIERPYIDPERVGIYGHSYGGYMSALAILKYPDLFQVAVAGAPVTDWRNYDTIYTERYMRTPQENPEGYDAGSCLTYAEDLRGKLLLLHGMVDDNVHPNNAWQLVDALQKAGKDFEIMFYPNRGHGLGRHSLEARWAFLHRHLTP